MVPAVFPAIAKMPSGVSRASRLPTRPMRLVEHVQGLEEHLLAGQRHEAHAGEHGEDDHRRDHVVGEGAEGVGRDVEVEPVDCALGLEAREGEESASLPGGEREGEQEHEAEREAPERDEQEAAAAGEEAGVLALHAAEAGDQGAGHVGQDGDLEGLDEGAAADLQEGDLVPEEQADRDPGDESDEDLLREAHGSEYRPGAPDGAREEPVIPRDFDWTGPEESAVSAPAALRIPRRPARRNSSK